MATQRFRNISSATVANLEATLREGAVVEVRGSRTKELRNRITIIDRPIERCLFLPGRENNIFTTIAETMWVLAGRDDMAWLTNYLPKAAEYSDDGYVWRGAYGPRLRRWGTTDQIDEVRRLLSTDPATRRAVMVLYDPARDFSPESKDIPCNNWLNWLLRNGRLHLNVCIRSNDAILGFSAINAFEWSVLQEMMAFWVKATLGDVTYFATSFHLYEEDYSWANRVLTGYNRLTCYDFGIQPSPFATAWPQFDEKLREWFSSEEAIRNSPDLPLDANRLVQDPFLDSTLRLLRLKWGVRKAGWDSARIKDELHALPEDDFAASAYELLSRKRPELLESIPQEKIAAFLEAYRRYKQ